MPDSTRYDQRPCPNCGHQETHLPIEPTELVISDCSECSYTFVKHPEDKIVAELDATRNSELRAIMEQWAEDGISVNPNHPDPSKSAGRKAAEELEKLIKDE